MQDRLADEYATSPHGSPRPGSGADGAGALARQRPAAFARRIRDGALNGAQEQQERLARRLRNVSVAAHRGAGDMEGEQQWIASAVHALADEVDHLASRVQGADLAQLIGQARQVAQRQPAAFIAASLVAGLAVSRLARLAAADSSPAGTIRAEVAHG